MATTQDKSNDLAGGNSDLRSPRLSRLRRLNFKKIVRLMLPPLLLEVRNYLRVAEREYVGPDWPKQDPRATGWDDPSVAETMHNTWDKFSSKVVGTAPLACWPWTADQTDMVPHNAFMTYAYLLARTAIGNRRVSVLDWGGALGHYALVANRLLPEISLDYTVKERPNVCAVGRTKLPQVSFISSDDECFSRGYDIVMASSSFQYVEDWRYVSRCLADATRKWLFITGLPTVQHSARFVAVQRQKHLGFHAEYLSWIHNQQEFLDYMSGELGLTLEREFLAWDTVHYRRAPEDPRGMGFLFRKRGEHE
jgi:putative methyltransferase (TIGR04325 family)